MSIYVHICEHFISLGHLGASKPPVMHLPDLRDARQVYNIEQDHNMTYNS